MYRVPIFYKEVSESGERVAEECCPDRQICGRAGFRLEIHDGKLVAANSGKQGGGQI